MSWISRASVRRENSQAKSSYTQSQSRTSSLSHSWSTQRHTLTQPTQHRVSHEPYAPSQSLSSGFGLKIPTTVNREVGAAFSYRSSNPNPPPRPSEALLVSVVELQRDVAKLRETCSSDREMERSRQHTLLLSRIDSIESRIAKLEEICASMQKITAGNDAFTSRTRFETSYRGARMSAPLNAKKTGVYRPSLLFIPAQSKPNPDDDETLSEAGDDLFA